ncbi:ribosomal protein S24E [Bradyrhizobium sp. AZCC 1578]|uniref:hypothetical protein n=1 Tax=Bradyrhizobium sp. AZCC 1578 TaxID=3117027 RepID=UPI002FF24280
MQKHEGTVADITEQFGEGRSKNRVYQYTTEAGFPAPLYTVGKNKIYDMRQVARYFTNRTDRRKTT